MWEKYKIDKEEGLKIPIKYKELKSFLEEQPTYTLHKPSIRKFTFRKTMVSYIDQQWQADLVEMQKYEKENKGHRYILTVIDIFSRYAWALPLKSKRGEEVKDLFKEIFEKASPEKLQFDEGKEFYNKPFKTSLEQRGIEYFSTYSDKAAIVEKFNRTLKTRMWKYFTEKETVVWIDSLKNFVAEYTVTRKNFAAGFFLRIGRFSRKIENLRVLILQDAQNRKNRKINTQCKKTHTWHRTAIYGKTSVHASDRRRSVGLGP